MNRPRPLDFAILLALGLMWGSAFLFIEYALESFGPISLAAIRIAMAALLLWVFARLRGHRLPTDRKTWVLCAVIGLIGLVMPFILIGWAQQEIESGRAAIIMSFTPLTTLMMAHVMTKDEKLTAGKIAGLALGFAGVFLLLGGLELGNYSAAMPRQLAVLLGTLGYALSGIMMRNLSHISPTSASAAIMIAASCMTLPLALAFDNALVGPVTLLSAMSVLFLGVFPSALATVVMIHLINRAGVTFMALSSYLIPAIGVIWGVLLLDEEITGQTAGAFALILTGVALASFSRRNRPAKEGS